VWPGGDIGPRPPGSYGDRDDRSQSTRFSTVAGVQTFL